MPTLRGVLPTLGACLLVACSPAPEPPTPPPATTTAAHATGPRVSSGEAYQRIRDYFELIEEALGPAEQLHRPLPYEPNPLLPDLSCADVPGGGPNWAMVALDENSLIGAEPVATYLDALKEWLRQHGFHEITDTTDGTARQLTAVGVDGIRLRAHKEADEDRVASLRLTSPCVWPDSVAGAPPPTMLPPIPS